MKCDNKKAKSLDWAIGELSKQRDDLEENIQVARKRDETGELIQEVNAQKKALDKRISSLQDGLKVSSELIDDSVSSLEEELQKVEDKIVIAKNRLKTLEEEEYLEELGKKLNGNFGTDQDSFENKSIEQNILSDDVAPLDNSLIPPSTFSNDELSPHTTKQLTIPTPTLMKAPANRIENEEETIQENTSRVDDSQVISKVSKLEQSPSHIVENLEECANALGMEPEYLLDKGMQAVLRMISRNGNKMSFPLEVEQVEKT